jgi:2',3'-cyclic-nucleotide 2'-phosphodiesterase (5'-nucleotidase family)
MVAALDAMGYNAIALGSEELQAPLTVLQDRFEEAGFPILSANVTPGRTLPNVQPFLLHKVGGHSVAIIGMTPAMAGERLVELGLAPLSPDPIAVVRRAVKQASRRADVIVLLSTLKRSSIETLVQEVPGIDAVVGLDGGTQFKPVAVPGAEGEVVLHAAGTRGQYMGSLTLHLDAEGKLTGFEGRTIALTDRYDRDPEIVAILREHAAEQ